jgi:hypothetical protein
MHEKVAEFTTAMNEKRLAESCTFRQHAVHVDVLEVVRVALLLFTFILAAVCTKKRKNK